MALPLLPMLPAVFVLPMLLSVLPMLPLDVAETEVVNSEREMRPSESVSMVLNCDAPGPKKPRLLSIEALEELRAPVLPAVVESVSDDDGPPGVELEGVLMLPEDDGLDIEPEEVEPDDDGRDIEPEEPDDDGPDEDGRCEEGDEGLEDELPLWATTLTVRMVRPLMTAANVRE